ncbi:GntR family transcriptional regulator [Rhodococcus sp. Leaf7]|uniref:MocR-like pyridoxine biosynthesis transcription factor PdxR n=1 Tax=unclassified Rhodococcus (in: high G+C Gram-positive bacteria) TaxID=192944 RepID=UPI0006F92F48|nr:MULTISPECIES: PLP-dependent aminotransferase family protein [unclassified Rhodococcus (in: high G+C Gram-positive bacteria)]KQU03716.1 GntR family transcriptional regulator [Rhodococcus sp. Leaf7]KQU39902.1 GntR family transcriptional regulator [Rhodococcus sp. Leaf247]
MAPQALPLCVDRSSSRPLPLQIADALRDAMSGGVLAPGSRLPSTRALASDLGVSRGVVDQAFDQLAAEGWTEGRAGSGTFVGSDIPAPTAPRIVTTTPSPDTGTPQTPSIALRPGIPWTPPSATAAWRRAWRTAGADTSPHAYPDPAGPLALRRSVSSLLARARGLTVEPDRVVITTGATHGLTLALAAVRADGSAGNGMKPVLAMEDPGYRTAASAAIAMGWTLHDVPVDAGGITVDALASAPRGTRAVYVTPSHQYPTGGTLDVGRRAALIDFARRHDTVVVEDDYDSEYRYDVAPLPALAHLDPDRVVYLGTIAKTLGAGVRLGWMVVPAALVRPVLDHRVAVGDFPSTPLCTAMTSLLDDGEWDRTVRAARRRYRDRDAAVRDSLSEFGELRGLGAGMHTTLILTPDRAEAVARGAARQGVEIPTVAPSARTNVGVGGLVIGYGRVDEAELRRALAVLADELRRHRD